MYSWIEEFEVNPVPVVVNVLVNCGPETDAGVNVGSDDELIVIVMSADVVEVKPKLLVTVRVIELLGVPKSLVRLLWVLITELLLRHS
jgi:hypothetical protein